MRFDTFNLKAYGPFSDRVIDIPSAYGHDLHIVYGKNEAGKSSLLNAIVSMLFGIETRTTDNFIHSYPNLRVGAKLSRKEESIDFLRKKARQNALVTKDETVIPDSKLESFLRGMDKSYFKQMYGLNTEGLRTGAESLLKGEGSFGELLFSASQGSSSISDVLKTLRQQADNIYKERRNKSLIVYQLLDSITTVRASLEKKKLSPSEYKNARANLEKHEKELKSLEQELRASEIQTKKLENLKNAIPIFNKYRENNAAATGLKLPLLPIDFGTELKNIQERSHAAKIKVNETQNQRNTLVSELEEIPASMLNDEQHLTIEKLERQEPLYENLLVQLRDEKETLNMYVSSLGDLLNQLGISEESLLPNAPDTRSLYSIKAILESKSEAEQTKKEAEETQSKLKLKLQKISAELESVGTASSHQELTKIHSLVEEHYRELNSHKSLDQEISSLADEIDNLRARLKMNEGFSSDQLSRYAFPSQQTHTEFTQKVSSVKQKIFGFDDDLIELSKTIIETQSKLDSLSALGKIYSEAELETARKQRDQTLREISHLKSLDKHPQLVEHISEADRIVDSMRANTERVTQATLHSAEIRESEAKRELTSTKKREAEQSLESLHADWARLYQDLPLPAPSLHEYSNFEKFRESLEEKVALLGQKQSLQKRLKEDTKNLVSQVNQSGITNSCSFPEIFTFLDSSLKAQASSMGKKEALEQQRQEIQSELSATQITLSNAVQNVERFSSEWTKLARDHALPVELDYSGIQEISNLRSQAISIQSDIAKSQSEIARLAKETRDYENERDQLITQNTLLLASHNLSETDITIKWKFLLKLKKAEEENDQKRKALSDKLKGVCETLHSKQEEEKAATQQLTAQLAQAQLHDTSEINVFLANLERKRSLEETSTSLKETLSETLPHLSDFNAIEAELSHLSSDEIEEEIMQQQQQLHETSSQRDTLRDLINEARKRLEGLDKIGSEAAELHQELETAKNSLRIYAKRYLTLKAAIEFLDEKIELFREENQGPMLTYTTEFFQQLTLGKYSRVTAQPDENNVIKLYAIDTEGKSTEVCHLSEGTSDQLYLSLRLAALKKHFVDDKHPPIPLILDDILITFDDERSEAVLKVLREFSNLTQILIFSHHTHVTAQAQAVKANIIDLAV